MARRMRSDIVFNNTRKGGVSTIRQAVPQIIAVSIKNILLIGFGMTLGFPTILIAGLSDGSEPSLQMSLEDLSWIGSINLVCVPIGCIISGPISQKLGRKTAMQLTNVPLILIWLLFKFSNERWQIYFGLSILGLLLGCIEAPVITYVAEITTPKLRGILSSTSTLSTILGILLEFLLGTFFHWRNVALISCIIPILSTNLLILVPESPHWLISKDRFLQARQSLAWLRGWVCISDIEAEYKEMYTELNQTFLVDIRLGTNNNHSKSSTPCKAFKSFTERTFILPFCLVTFVFFLRHFTGMTNIQTYAVEIFTTFNTPINKYYATVFLGLVELIGCITCVVLIHNVGKRLLTLVTMFCSSLCLIGVGVHAYIQNITDLTIEKGNATDLRGVIIVDFTDPNWIPFGLLIGFAYFSHVGLRILPWILTGEVYTNEMRAIASGLSAACGYVFGFLANKLFYLILSMITVYGLFFFYAGLSFVGIVILYFTLPETEGKTLAEIEDFFSGNKVIEMRCRNRSVDDMFEVNLDRLSCTAANERNSYRKFTDLDEPL